MNIGIEDLAYCMRIIREATEALDRVAVPRVAEQLALAERIELLAQQRDAQVRELESETAEANRLSELVRQCNEERGTIQRLLADAGCPTNEPSQGIVRLARELSKRTDDLCTETERADTLSGHLQEVVRVMVSAGIDTSVPTIESGVAQLIGERAQLRRMHDGVSADLDRERREKQEALDEAAARELKLIEERDAANRDVRFFQREARDCGVKIRQLTEQHAALSERYRHAITERDRAAAEAAHAEGWRLQCSTNERTIQRLTAKIKSLESQGVGGEKRRQVPRKTPAKSKKRGPHR